MELHVGVFDLGQLLMHVADLAGVRARQAGLMFDYVPSDDLPALVSGDERAVRQVLLNLLGNAVKFTESGGVKFRARVMPDDSRCILRCEIEDSGVGIAPDDLERLFEPYERSDQHRRRIEGTGLGLTITRRLLEAMGGRLEVTTLPGSGSIFAFELALERHEGAGTRPLAAARISGYAGPRRRALIADDEQTNRTLLVKLLTDLGFETEQVANGAEALKAVAQRRPDIVITDLAMPIMDGLAVARALRRNAATHALPVLAVSASASDYTREEALAAGCSDFLPKPLRSAELLERLRTLLDLEWIVAPVVADAAPILVPAAADAAIDAVQAADLYDLAMKGEVKELISRAEAAMQADPAGTPVYEELRRLARSFDMKAVRRRLDDARGAQDR